MYTVLGTRVLKQYCQTVPKITLFSEQSTASPHGQTADHVPVHGTSVWKPLVQTLLQPSREEAGGEGAAEHFLELYLVARNSTKGERKQ